MNTSSAEPPAKPPDAAAWLGSGNIATLLRSGPWPGGLGPPGTWPRSLLTTMGIALASPLPMLIAWGAESSILYNDAFCTRLAPKLHPATLGGRFAEFLPELHAALDPAFTRVRLGDSVALLTAYIPLMRAEQLENRWFAVSVGAIRDESGAVGGVLAVLMETTDLVNAERRLTTLRHLALQTAESRTPTEACATAATVLWMNPVDLPFGAVYLVDEEAAQAVRACLFGLARDHPTSPAIIALDAADAGRAWPIARIIGSGVAEMVSGPASQAEPVPGQPPSEPAGTAMLIPLRVPGADRPYGVLVAGVSPRRPLDRSYREFIDLAAIQLAGAICHARGVQHADDEACASGSGAPGEVEGLRHDLDEARAKVRATQYDAESTHRAKDEFLALLGHELRDPLAPMTIVLRLMKHEAGAEDMFPKERGILERQLARLSELVDDLSDVSRMTRGGAVLERRRVSLAAVLTRAMAMGAPFLERHMHQLDVTIKATGLDLDADETRLAQAFAGLITSAVRHAKEGSRVVVTARREDDDVILTIREVLGEAAAEAPAAAVQEAAAPTRRGLGVGFPILRNIIALHRGSIVATGGDEAGGFDVRLPLAAPADEPAGP